MNNEKSFAVRVKEAQQMTGEQYIDSLNKRLNQYGPSNWKVVDLSFINLRLLQIVDVYTDKVVISNFDAPLFVEDAYNFLIAAMILNSEAYESGRKQGRLEKQQEFRAVLGLENESILYHGHGPTA